MLYLITLIWILYSAYKFDICKQIKNRNSTYVLIGIWLTLISALQYRMGADVVAYMGEYALYEKDFSWEYISHFVLRRPGWVLLNQLCSLVSEDFVCLKSVIAVFVNFAVFRFFRKHSNYPFISVFLYFIVIYLALSFNILRQSISVAIFLLSYDYLKNNKLIPYFICCVLALLFHDSAVVLFFLPLARYIKLSRGNLIVFAGVSILLLFVLAFNPGNVRSWLMNVVYFLGDENMTGQADLLTAKDYTGYFNIFGIIKYIIFFIFYCYVFYDSSTKTMHSDRLLNGLFVAFLVLYVLNVALPIVYRVYFYLQIIYILFATEFIGEKSQSGHLNYMQSAANKYFLTIMLFIIVHVVPLVTSNVMRVQYFPYSSIFDKTISYERERIYGDKENLIIY